MTPNPRPDPDANFFDVQIEQERLPADADGWAVPPASRRRGRLGRRLAAVAAAAIASCCRVLAAVDVRSATRRRGASRRRPVRLGMAARRHAARGRFARWAGPAVLALGAVVALVVATRPDGQRPRVEVAAPPRANRSGSATRPAPPTVEARPLRRPRPASRRSAAGARRRRPSARGPRVSTARPSARASDRGRREAVAPPPAIRRPAPATRPGRKPAAPGPAAATRNAVAAEFGIER
jgi:hypothetical protein